MAYATQTDIETIYGADALYVADRDGDGVADAAAVTRALDAAGAEIDTYLAVRYALPLVSIPAMLMQLAVDIALYRLAASHDVLTDEHRVRYEDAIKLLDRIAKGTAGLPVSADSDGDGDLDDEFGGGRPQPIVATGPERLFSRDKMRGL